MAETSSVRVVAAVIERDGRYLVGQRPEHKRHGGLWEFPGGKLRDGETVREAAERELSEELDLHVTGVGDVRLSVPDGSSPFVIDFVDVTATGSEEAREHSDLGWFTPTELRSLPLAPADATFVASLVRDDS